MPLLKNMSEKKSHIQNIIHAIDSYLWQKGYRIERVRITVRSLFLFNVIVFIPALVLSAFWLAPLSFSLASLLAFWNFTSMAKHIVQNFPVGGVAKISISTLLYWFIRLIIIVGISFVAIVVLKMPLFAWLAGLGTQLFISPLMNIVHK